MIYIAVMIPGIVIGIATLIALVTAFNWINPLMAAVWPQGSSSRRSWRWATAR
jgi:spermidine/putrescine transport system permease protein